MNTAQFAQPNLGVSVLPAALGVSAGVFFGLIGVVGLFVIVVVANKSDVDPSGQRPLGVYLFAISFVSVFASLIGSFAIVLALVQLIGSHGASPGSSLHPIGDAVARVVVLAGLVFVVAMALLVTHLRRGLRLVNWAEPQPSPVARVGRSYVASVCFVALLIAAVATVFFVYLACRIIAPGVFELSTSRIAEARILIATLYLALAAAAIVFTHLRWLPPKAASWYWRGPGGPVQAGAVPQQVTQPPAPPAAPGTEGPTFTPTAPPRDPAG